MSESEKRIADTRGKFLQVVKDSRRIEDASWTTGRILLSNKRLVLAGSSGNRTIPLSEIVAIGDRFDVNQAVTRVSRYVSIRFDNHVVLIAPEDPEGFEHDIYSALLDGEILLVRHPAVEGGVVQDADWEKARVKIGEESVDIATVNGEFVEIEMDDIGTVSRGERTVLDETRQVIEVEHTESTTSVETYLSGAERQCSFLGSLFQKGEAQNRGDVDLDETEQEVLMALYSGISPFEIPDFTGLDVDQVEGTFERLIELDVLDEVRKRREVTLTTRGRNIASESINDQ